MLKQLVLIVAALGLVAGHARLLEPPARSSLWRFPEFSQYNPEENHSDDEIWCANIRQFEFDTRCGICGDPAEQPMPRDNENGGRYGRGIIARTYSPGQTIPIYIQSYAPHGGGYEVQLCTTLPETESCFQPLMLSNGQTFWPTRLGDGDFDIRFEATLPAGVRCDHCTIRMHYRGAQHWGTCDTSKTCECDPNSGNPPGGMGCSEQQTFRSCADIKIQ